MIAGQISSQLHHACEKSAVLQRCIPARLARKELENNRFPGSDLHCSHNNWKKYKLLIDPWLFPISLISYFVVKGLWRWPHGAGSWPLSPAAAALSEFVIANLGLTPAVNKHRSAQRHRHSDGCCNYRISLPSDIMYTVCRCVCVSVCVYTGTQAATHSYRLSCGQISDSEKRPSCVDLKPAPKRLN